MKQATLHSVLSRRQMVTLAAAGLGASLLPLRGFADSSSGSSSSGSSSTFVLASTGLVGKRVVVVGAGMAGMTAAKYLRLWGGSGLQVTLVEPDAAYTSSIMSNLVLNGSRSLASLQFSRAALATKYGVVHKVGSVAAVNADAHTVTLADGSVLGYDRLVLAPGISFDDAYGLTPADYESRTPHAWRAGAQTTLLRTQIAAMVNGDTFVMTIPKAPYRCPPGPYERACVVADHLKTTQRASCKVLVLDENLSIQAERHTFETAFSQIHASVIQYVPGVSNISIGAVSRLVTYTANGTAQQVQARVVNPIVPHRAAGSATGEWLAAAGLNNGAGGRWAAVNVLSYESTAARGADIHVIGDASSCGMPKAGHVANQEAKICADAIVRLLAGGSPDPQPVANSACYSPITASTASWLTAVYQYDPAGKGSMKVASNGGQTVVNGVPAAATEAATINGDNFKDMGTWFSTLMADTTA